MLREHANHQLVSLSSEGGNNLFPTIRQVRSEVTDTAKMEVDAACTALEHSREELLQSQRELRTAQVRFQAT